MTIKIKAIVWNHHDSQFGKAWISDFPNMDCRYAIWNERDTGDKAEKRLKINAIIFFTLLGIIAVTIFFLQFK